MKAKYQHLKLAELPREFKYVALDPRTGLQVALKTMESSEDSLSFVFRTPQELSMIVPVETTLPSTREEKGWNALMILGEMPFGTVQGLIATISSTLKEKGLGTCVISTFASDYFFVRKDKLELVKLALSNSGWIIQNP